MSDVVTRDEFYRLMSLINNLSLTVTRVDWSYKEIPSGLVDGSNKVFYLDFVPDPVEGLHFYVGGTLQGEVQYTVRGRRVSLTKAPGSGIELRATYPYRLDNVIVEFNPNTMKKIKTAVSEAGGKTKLKYYGFPSGTSILFHKRRIAT